MYSGSLLEKMYSTRVCGGGRSSSTGVSLCAHHVLLNSALEPTSEASSCTCNSAFESGGGSHCCCRMLPARPAMRSSGDFRKSSGRLGSGYISTRLIACCWCYL